MSKIYRIVTLFSWKTNICSHDSKLNFRFSKGKKVYFNAAVRTQIKTMCVTNKLTPIMCKSEKTCIFLTKLIIFTAQTWTKGYSA